MTKSVNYSYGKPYQFKEVKDPAGHFWFPKAFIDDKLWARMSKSTKVVYPVIGTHFDKTGECFPGERAIAIQAGYTDKQAREGIKGLSQCPDIEVIKYVTGRGMRSKKYRKKVKADRTKAFPFHNAICKSGTWSQLKPTSQALYPVLRRFGFFDDEIASIYTEEEDLNFDVLNLRESYSDRLWDYCEAEVDVLAEYAGICERSVSTALNDLEKRALVEPCCDEIWGPWAGGWKVLLRPRSYPDCNSLNEKILKRYPLPGQMLEKITA